MLFPVMLRRCILLFLVTLALVLGCQAIRASAPLPIADVTQPAATLTVQPVENPSPFIWWEAEKPTATNFPPAAQNPFAPQNAFEASVLSEHAWIGIDGPRREPAFLEYQVNVPTAGTYAFYSRKFWQHGPFRWRWDDQSWNEATRDLYLMDTAELRQFIGANWVELGTVTLSAGPHRLRIELTRNEGAAAFDCFILTQGAFQARGPLRPDQRYEANIPGWWLFDPKRDTGQVSPIDLRHLNEQFAGEKGHIRVQGDRFIHEKTGEVVRFWAINGGDLNQSPAQMQQMARFLAKRGVNLVRVHTHFWGDDLRQINSEKLDQFFAWVAALKREGIYTSLSIYFPLWLKLDAISGFAGYTGQHPFSLLFFNSEFQQIYFSWWRSLLTTRNPYTGLTLAEDPALAMAELVNEDSYLFWTFRPYETIPAEQMAILERQFGDWLRRKYGSLQGAIAAWSAVEPVRGDAPQQGRMGFLPLYAIVNQRTTRRAQDTVAFLYESQRQFFQQAIRYLKEDLGYQGLVYGSNWQTADAQILTPIDKYSNAVGDFFDRHGYFNGEHKGDRASFSLNNGDLYQDRTSLRFDKNATPDSPLMDLQYDGKPSTISEINWSMPNRFRAEFPFLAATYGLLQDSDGIFFFATGNHTWESTLGKFAIAHPSILGQFPATALVYRKGLLRPGETVVDVTLDPAQLMALAGAPLSAPQNFDELRSQDIPPDQTVHSNQEVQIDPLAFWVGQVKFRFGGSPNSGNLANRITNLAPYIDRPRQILHSTTGELTWDYRTGLVTVNADQVQGAAGFLRQAGKIALQDVRLSSDLDYGTMLLVSLDGKAIASSDRLLLQVMSEDQNFGWRTSGFPERTIESVGRPPLVVRNLTGRVRLKRRDAARLRVTALDENGDRLQTIGNAAQITLQPQVFYYLIERPSAG